LLRSNGAVEVMMNLLLTDSEWLKCHLSSRGEPLRTYGYVLRGGVHGERRIQYPPWLERILAQVQELGCKNWRSGIDPMARVG
jgi:hypothetical protein